MITIFVSFLLTAIPFAVLQFLKIAAWTYYVPCSLILALLWLRIIFSRYCSIGRAFVSNHPDILQNEIDKDMFLASPSIFLPSLELYTAFARFDFSSTIGWSFLISLVYGIVSLIRAEWIALALCIMVAIYSVFCNMKNAFETGNQDQDAVRVVHRYVKSKKMKTKEMTDMELVQLAERYAKISDRLKSYNEA